MELLSENKLLSNLSLINVNDGDYSLYTQCGCGNTTANMHINSLNVKINYKSRWIGSDAIEETIEGKIIDILSENFFIMQLDNNCIYNIIFLGTPTTSYCSAGLDFMPFLSNCPTWNKLFNVILIHDETICNCINNNKDDSDVEDNDKEDKDNYEKKYKFLNNLKFVKTGQIYKYKPTKSYNDLSNFNSINHYILFAYPNPCIYSQKLEVTISEMILTKQKLPTIIWIDGEYNVYTQKPEHPSNYTDGLLLIDKDESFDSNIIITNKNNVHKYDDILRDTYIKFHRSQLRNMNDMKPQYRKININDIIDKITKYTTIVDVDVFQWKFKDDNSPIFLTCEKSFWENNISDVLNKYKKQDEITTNVEVKFCTPECEFSMGNIGILIKSNSKRKSIITTLIESECIKELQKIR